MTVRELLTELVALDMDAEVMVETPGHYSANGVPVRIPTRDVQNGIFAVKEGEAGDNRKRRYAIIVGTDVWGQSPKKGPKP